MLVYPGLQSISVFVFVLFLFYLPCAVLLSSVILIVSFILLYWIFLLYCYQWTMMGCHSCMYIPQGS